MIETALYYAERYNFAVLPLHGIIKDIDGKGHCTCPNTSICSIPDHRGKTPAGKHPWTTNGLKNASSNPDVLRNLFSHRPNCNIGIVTGPISGIFVLDVDGIEGEKSLANYPALPPTLTSTTGNGRHMVFRYPAIKVYTRAGKFAPGLDIRGEGGYIVAPPSIHFNGAVYQWLDDDIEIAEAPQWLLDIVCKAPEERIYQIPITNDALPDWTIDQVREMLSFIDPDCGYEDWIQIGMGLHDAGYSNAIWDEWSKRGSKYKPGCTVPHWKSFHGEGGVSFGTIVHVASLSGWKPKAIENGGDINGGDILTDHPAFQLIMKIKAEWNKPKHNTASSSSASLASTAFNPMLIPGLVGDTINAIVETAQKPQPELAMLNTLAALGAVFGRRYASSMDTRTNLYTVGIAVTAAGKDHSRRFIKRLMIDAGLEGFIGGDTLVSGAGLMTAVEKQPAQVMHLDEFGMLLEAITDQRGASHMKAASKVITEMYSTSSMAYLGGQYADRKTEPVKIPFPNLCIYGTTTPDKYVSSMNRSVIQSGELNRFIVIRPEIDRPERRRYMGGATPTDQLVAQWRALISDGPILNNSLIVPEPIIVSWAGLEDRVWDMGLFEDKCIAESETGALWGRYRENTIKISMILAISRNPLVPVITDVDFDIAEAIIRQACGYVQTLANEHISDSQHEKDCNDILGIIRDGGGRVTKKHLARSMRRLNAKQRADALASLLEQNRISIDKENQETGAGAPILWISTT